MKPGDLVKKASSSLEKTRIIGIIIEIKDNHWYPNSARILWNKGKIEWLPTEILTKIIVNE